MKEIRAFVFDMDGVLIDSERIVGNCWREIARKNSLPKIEIAINGCIGLNKYDTKLFFCKMYGDDIDFDEFDQKCTSMFKETIAREGLPLKAGVHEILSYLKENRIPTALASSTKYKSVLFHLQSLSLDQYFDVIIGGDMVVHSKPDPEIYQMACEKLGIDPEFCVAVEDSPNGIRSSAAAGMIAVMVPDLVQPDAEISSLLYRKYDTLFDMKKELTDSLMQEGIS